MHTQNRLRRVDGLRGIAILLVLIGHEADFTLGYHVVGEIGAVGVLVFFILSGFLITGMLERELNETGTIDRREFYLRRGIRILPAFWFLIAVTVLLKLAGLVTDVTWKAVAACVFFARNIRGRGQSLGHIWSLSLQEQFYLLWPQLMSRVGLRRSLQTAAALTIAGTIWRTWAIATHLYPYETDVFYLRTDFRLDSILVGCVIALALRDARLSGAVTRAFERVPTVAVTAALIVWSLTASQSVLLRPIFLTVETILATGAFGGLLVAKASSFAVRLCDHKVLVWLGMMSYSLYLWQQLFLVTRDPSWGVLRVFPVNLICVVAAALISNRLIERPALQLRRRWSRATVVKQPAVLGA